MFLSVGVKLHPIFIECILSQLQIVLNPAVAIVEDLKSPCGKYSWPVLIFMLNGRH
jgi:hypothetical protein